uniref:(northern house mosquito) hypothetical protein n=1 Tax=Culex pipiens TaxID=7175 RepID=A0A8D8A427_CULPI
MSTTIAMSGDGDGVNLGEPTADEQFPTPELETVKREISKLMNNRAVDKDRLHGELFKYGGEQLARAIHLVISKIWREEKLPEECVPSTKRVISWTAVTTAASRLSMRPIKSSP